MVWQGDAVGGEGRGFKEQTVAVEPRWHSLLPMTPGFGNIPKVGCPRKIPSPSTGMVNVVRGAEGRAVAKGGNVHEGALLLFGRDRHEDSRVEERSKHGTRTNLGLRWAGEA